MDRGFCCSTTVSDFPLVAKDEYFGRKLESIDGSKPSLASAPMQFVYSTSASIRPGVEISRILFISNGDFIYPGET